MSPRPSLLAVPPHASAWRYLRSGYAVISCRDSGPKVAGTVQEPSWPYDVPFSQRCRVLVRKVVTSKSGSRINSGMSGSSRAAVNGCEPNGQFRAEHHRRPGTAMECCTVLRDLVVRCRVAILLSSFLLPWLYANTA